MLQKTERRLSRWYSRRLITHPPLPNVLAQLPPQAPGQGNAGPGRQGENPPTSQTSTNSQRERLVLAGARRYAANAINRSLKRSFRSQGQLNTTVQLFLHINLLFFWFLPSLVRDHATLLTGFSLLSAASCQERWRGGVPRSRGLRIIE